MGREDVRAPGGGEERAAGEGAGLTKVCPCCGQRLFSDMDVCYGCLYDFRRRPGGGAGGGGGALGASARDVPRPEEPDPPRAPEAPEDVRDEGAWGDPAGGPGGVLDEGAWVGDPEGPWDAGLPPASLDDGGWPASSPARATAPPAGRLPTRLGLRVETGDACVVVPLGEDGLVIGRGESCDVVLRSPSVSRRHVRVVPADAGAVVQDLGSTNPARLGGRLVTDVARLLPGEGFELCGTRVSLVRVG